MITSESKSILAKLMATENITVQHRKVSTASFDPKNRVLTCPIWKDMDGDLYDLLMGHEVGHALYTPADGWHDVASKNGKSYKHFLNVVEDARIEKRIKRKYPGLQGPFHRAYNQLNQKDFFGIEGRTRKLAFIDRLNLHFKVGPFMKVEFDNPTEYELVGEVHDLETWEDVLRVTQKIWEYSKGEQQELMEQLLKDFNKVPGSTDDLDDSEFYEQEFDSEDDFDDEEISNFSNMDSEEDDTGETGNEQDKPEIQRFKDSAPSVQDQFMPKAETDENFRRNEAKLLDEKTKEFMYAHVPTEVDLKHIITPAKRVISQLTEFYAQDSSYRIMMETELQDFKRKNDRYISLLAKEFEMRKAATKFSKARTSSTGDIDINKIYKYKLDDAIFKKVMRVPKGKSHGLILLLDKSGSMSDNLGSSIEQILVLTYFCRKVNIPFSVYGFGNALDAYYMDNNYDTHMSSTNLIAKQFKPKPGELAMKPVFLREYLNSGMSSAEFQKSVKMMLMLRRSFDGRSRSYYTSIPPSESLSNTPLIESLFASRKIIDEFRTKNNLDIVNMVVVHDGDADAIRHMYKEDMDVNDLDFSYKTTPASPELYSMHLIDRKNKVQIQYTDCYNSLRSATMQWLTKVTGAKIYGFFLTGAGNRYMRGAINSRYEDEEIRTINKIQDSWERSRRQDEWLEKNLKIMKKQKFMECPTSGYDNFFLIPGGSDLKIGEDEIVIDGKVTNGKLASAFIKMTKSRQINRVLVSKFIGGIAV